MQQHNSTFAKKIIYSAVVGILGFTSQLVSAEEDINKVKFPDQYQTWAATEELEERGDMLANYPASIILWAGSPYAKEYHSPRGHQFAGADVTHTLRSGVKPPAGESGLSASCWTCKTPDATRLMGELGLQEFAAKNFADVGAEVNSVVYCSDCHEAGSDKLAMPRPHAQDAMKKIQMPFDKQTTEMQGAQVCGQCHVTYYFQPEESNKVNIPWIFGSTADLIEKYYDTRRFYEWVHPISKTPLVKARHPEFEHWSRSKHAAAGATCVTCHMPKETNQKGVEFTNHKVEEALPNFDKTCKQCHANEEQTRAALAKDKSDIDSQARNVEGLLIKAHYEAKAAWDAGANWHQMNDIIMGIRHAQWRWDFAMSSHGLYAHNPEEGKDLLSAATERVTLARTLLKSLLETLKVTDVTYPDFSTKEKAHAAIGLNVDELTKEKQKFLKEEVDKHWNPLTNKGYK